MMALFPGTSERKMIMLAFHSLDFLTCIKFVPWDEVTKDYLLIWPMEKPKGWVLLFDYYYSQSWPLRTATTTMV